METYISLVSYTGEGVQHMDESPDRLDDARGVVESMGGELTHFFLTMGQYDAVAIMEMPDAETATQAGITISGGGAIRTETLRAFPEDEYRELIAGLP
ncbi:GYD domain-containing protein [Haloplanus rubicundus]|uniref:GYD domain-containing protein n=1 Tax=Haloplanus rubicundus TaxID=1547898 RepID=A0A345E8Y5_9EURY|nr:GYD domain-containing protein [Haloplanus rubicundus]AXG05306.1 GYD domain-containing protein [Haloplanus rubicundus]AXG08657.1 GYD domain-containing protein [Haloplanus rubicundus]